MGPVAGSTVTRPRYRNIGLFSQVYWLLCLGVFEFGQDGA
jgi:hypothetical protein